MRHCPLCTHAVGEREAEVVSRTLSGFLDVGQYKRLEVWLEVEDVPAIYTPRDLCRRCLVDTMAAAV